MAPLILDIEKNEEYTDHHGDNDADHHQETTVHPAASTQVVRFLVKHTETQYCSENSESELIPPLPY